MKEKFVRTSEHKKVSDIQVNHSPEYTKKNLELIKSVVEDLKAASNTNSEQEEKINFEDIQMASSSEYSDITIDNAHKHI